MEHMTMNIRKTYKMLVLFLRLANSCFMRSDLFQWKVTTEKVMYTFPVFKPVWLSLNQQKRTKRHAVAYLIYSFSYLHFVATFDFPK